MMHWKMEPYRGSTKNYEVICSDVDRIACRIVGRAMAKMGPRFYETYRNLDVLNDGEVRMSMKMAALNAKDKRKWQR